MVGRFHRLHLHRHADDRRVRRHAAGLPSCPYLGPFRSFSKVISLMHAVKILMKYSLSKGRRECLLEHVFL